MGNAWQITCLTHWQDLRKTAPARRDDADSTTVRQGEATPPGRFYVSSDWLRQRSFLAGAGIFLCCLLCLFTSNVSIAQSASQVTEEKQNLQDVRNAIKQFLIREANGMPGTVRVEVGQIDPRLNLTACVAIEPYLPAGSRPWGKVNVGARCNAPARWNIFVPGAVRVTGHYYVSARPVMQGQTLTDADITMMEGDLTSMSANVVTDPSQAIGRTSTMSLSAGITLRQDSLRLQQVVIQGQTIRLISHGDGFKVSTDGLALNSASAGQLVKVKVNSGQVISGTAKLGGVVEIVN